MENLEYLNMIEFTKEDYDRKNKEKYGNELLPLESLINKICDIVKDEEGTWRDVVCILNNVYSLL